MKIEFNKMVEEQKPHFKDGEGQYNVKMFSDDLAKIMYGTLPAGSSIGYHKHETNAEMIYILEGNGKCLYDDTEERLTAGDGHYCPKGHAHSLINDSDKDLVFFAVVPEQQTAWARGRFPGPIFFDHGDGDTGTI